MTPSPAARALPHMNGEEALSALSDIGELYLRALLGDVAQLPGVARQEDRRAVTILRHAAAVGRHEFLEVGLGLGRNPARRLERCWLEVDHHGIFGLDAGLEHVELQLAYHADDIVAADHAAEHLGDTL